MEHMEEDRWTKCANEGQTCNHSGLVRYGKKIDGYICSGRDGSSLNAIIAVFGGDPHREKEICGN